MGKSRVFRRAPILPAFARSGSTPPRAAPHPSYSVGGLDAGPKFRETFDPRQTRRNYWRIARSNRDFIRIPEKNCRISDSGFQIANHYPEMICDLKSSNLEYESNSWDPYHLDSGACEGPGVGRFQPTPGPRCDLSADQYASELITSPWAREASCHTVT
jgi:hypothetical protein